MTYSSFQRHIQIVPWGISYGFKNNENLNHGYLFATYIDSSNDTKADASVSTFTYESDEYT